MAAVDPVLSISVAAALPNRISIHLADALKNKLVSVVVAALAVRFFSIVMEGEDGVAALYGAGIAAVLLGLSAYAAVEGWADSLQAKRSTADLDERSRL